jgi:hypothetical protein
VLRVRYSVPCGTAPVSAGPLGVTMSPILRTTVFILLVIADILLFIGPLLLKSGGNLEGALWVSSAALVVIAGIARVVIGKRAASSSWKVALRPAVVGSAVVLATLAFLLVVLPLVAIANR